LKPGGRLVFFLPVVNDEYEEVDIPVVEGMKLVANSIEVRDSPSYLLSMNKD